MNTSNVFTRYERDVNSGSNYGEQLSPTSAQNVYISEDEVLFRLVANALTGTYGQPHNNMPPYIVAYCWRRIS